MKTTIIRVGMTIGSLLVSGGSFCLAADATKTNPSTNLSAQWTFDKDQAGKLPIGVTVIEFKYLHFFLLHIRCLIRQ